MNPIQENMSRAALVTQADLIPRETLLLEGVDFKRLAMSRKSLRKVIVALEQNKHVRPVDVERSRYILEIISGWARRNYHLQQAVYRYLQEDDEPTEEEEFGG